MNWKKILLVIIGIFLMVIGLNSPMTLIFPMWIFVYLLKDKIKNLTKRIPLWISFIGLGVIFGLLTELFAIIQNFAKPAEQKILLSANPINDMIFGFVYYFFVIFTWYLLLRRMKYSKKDVFLITGILGILTEETGQVFLRIFTDPVIGFLYAILVMFVYGVFPMLTYMLNENRFNNKKANVIKRYLFAFIAMFIQWAIYGLFVLPLLRKIFGQ